MIRLQCRILNKFTVIKNNQSTLALFNLSSNKRLIRSFSNFENNGNGGIRTFNDLLNKRQYEARCSIVVQVNSENSYSELYQYCSQIGPIKNAYHYRIDQKAHRILIEYENEEIACEAIKTTVFDGPQIPAGSRFMWFRATKNKLAASSSNDDIPPLKVVDGFNEITSNDLHDLLLKENSIDNQINQLYKSTCINDLGTRLRFLAALQIENSVSGLFPYAKAYPFGSSVNGFGKMGSDLDMNLDVLPSSNFNCDEQDIHRLVFHTRSALQCKRSVAQRHLNIMSEIIHQILPGISSVKTILMASVPIVRYHHEYLNLQVDLSMNNMSGVYMSELLYLLGELDTRVRPLMFCIRRWAQTKQITRSQPGTWISNFGLTCLVIYFLQQLQQPLLPTLNYLNGLGGDADLRKLESSNVTYIRDFNCVHFKTENTKTLSELLHEFFQFYSQLKFTEKSMSLHLGRAIDKVDPACMHIINPIEPILNVTKNVNAKECEHLQMKMRIASEIIDNQLNENAADKSKPWGLIELFKQQLYPPQEHLNSTAIRQLIYTSVENVNLEKHAIQNSARKDVANLMNIKGLYAYDENIKKSKNNSVDDKQKINKRSRTVDQLIKKINLNPKQNETSGNLNINIVKTKPENERQTISKKIQRPLKRHRK